MDWRTQFTCNFHVLSVKAYWSVNKWCVCVCVCVCVRVCVCVYIYILVQINSSDLFLWVGFIYCVNFFLKKKLYGPFLWMGFNCLKATEPLQRGTLRFTNKVPSILSFPKKLLPTIFQFSRTDSKFWCDVLRDLVPFVQFKKREKHLWRSKVY